MATGSGVNQGKTAFLEVFLPGNHDADEYAVNEAWHAAGPQHFFNRDPIQLNLGLADILPDEQRLFFDVIAPCRDAWDGAFCCGSCSIQRRSAIEDAGGVPTESITEDILSTLVLLRKGSITRGV